MTDAPAPIRIDGTPLPLACLAAALTGPVRVELSETARGALRRGRTALDAAAAAGQPIYGMTTGVGAMKHQCHEGTAMAAFNHSLGLAHEVAVGDPVAPGIVRLALVTRLNTVATGRVGVSEAFADCLAGMLDHDILPRMTRHGSVGCGDLGQLGQLATAMTGVGTVIHHGREMPAAEAFATAGLALHEMRPREGLAAVASNSFGLASATSAVFTAQARIAQALAQAPVTALAWGVDRAVWQAAEASLIPGEAAVAQWLSDATAAQMLWPARDGVQDALSARFLVQVLAPCVKVTNEAIDLLQISSAQVDDNPTVLPDGRIVTSGGSHHATLALRLGTVQAALAMLGRNLFNHCLMLTNGQLPGLPVNLVPEGVVATGYGPLMKLAMEQSARIATAAAPVAPHALTLAAGLEDEALLLPLTAERLAEQAEALGWLLTLTALLSVQAIALRNLPVTGLAARMTTLVRRHVPPFTGDIPLSRRLADLHATLAAEAPQAWLPGAELLPFRPGATVEKSQDRHKEKNGFKKLDQPTSRPATPHPFQQET